MTPEMREIWLQEMLQDDEYEEVDYEELYYSIYPEEEEDQ